MMTAPTFPRAFLVMTLAWTMPTVAQERPTDQWLTNPVDDRTFQTYLEFFAYDEELPFDVQDLAVESAEGLRTERFTFESTPGERVPALQYRPSGSEGRGGPAIVLLHGGSPRGKDTRYTVSPAEAWARAGFTVLTIDMQHFGERNTGLLQTFSETEKHERLYNQESTYLAWIVQTVKDVSRSYDFLMRERGADPDRIALVGISRGAQTAVLAGGADDRFAAVVMLFGGHFDLFEGGHLAAACPANYIGRIHPRPLLMVNAERDADFLKETSVLPMHRLAGESTDFHWTSGGHGYMAEEDRAFLLDWLRERLR